MHAPMYTLRTRTRNTTPSVFASRRARTTRMPLLPRTHGAAILTGTGKAWPYRMVAPELRRTSRTGLSKRPAISSAKGTLEFVAVTAEPRSARHVMHDGEFVARLAVGRSGEPSSGVLRIWSPKGKSDVYASMRGIAGQVKISLHESGTCIAGLTKEFAAKEAGAVAAIGGVRHQSKWVRLRHAGEQIVTPLQFAVPDSELRLRSGETATDDEIERIEAPGSGRSIVISCIFSGQCFSNDNWPGRRNKTRLAGSKLLPNGEKFWLLWQDCPTSVLFGVEY